MVETTSRYQLKINHPFSENDLRKGLYIVVNYATRIPPHIGIIIDNKYHSLNIKGHDINKSVEVVIKTVNQKKIPSLFIKIKPHSILSDAELSEHFINDVKQFSSVQVGSTTCFAPIKLFFEEVYSVSMTDVTYFYQLIPKLSEQLVKHTSSLFLDTENFQFPVYNKEELYNGIEQVLAHLNENNQ